MITDMLKWYQKNKQFRQTHRELSVLTDRELYDLGISRDSIIQVAKEATFGKDVA